MAIATNVKGISKRLPRYFENLSHILTPKDHPVYTWEEWTRCMQPHGGDALASARLLNSVGEVLWFDEV